MLMAYPQRSRVIHRNRGFMHNFMLSRKADHAVRYGTARWAGPAADRAVNWAGPVGKSGILVDEFAVEHLADGEHGLANLVITILRLLDFLTGVHHGGVVAVAELSADIGQRAIGLFADDVHGDLAG